MSASSWWRRVRPWNRDLDADTLDAGSNRSPSREHHSRRVPGQIAPVRRSSSSRRGMRRAVVLAGLCPIRERRRRP